MKAPNRESVDARYVAPAFWRDSFSQLQPGDFTILSEGDPKIDVLVAKLPGGHFAKCPIEGPYAWQWNGDLNQPSLSPSVKVTGFDAGVRAERWHGWLRNGRWESC